MPSERLQRQIDAILGLRRLRLELQDVGSSDGVTIVAPEPGETLPSGGAEGD